MSATAKLAREHFAFMRGIVQGAEPNKLWNSYLFVHGRYDPRAAARRLQWIKQEFARAARRHGRHALARLIVFDSAKLAPAVTPAIVPLPGTLVSPINGNPARPSFEAFCQRHAEFYTQKELRPAYEGAYGPLEGSETDRARSDRHSRLIARQLDALNWLEGVAAETPQAGHDLAAWLDPVMVKPLTAQGVVTLGQLIEHINGRGPTWWRPLPNIGPEKALRLQAWLGHQASAIGQSLGEHVALPRRSLTLARLAAVVPPATAIVPLDKFRVPAALDGSSGHYRAPPHQCLLQASNDYDAILAWLNSKQAGHTQRAYTKEAERLLLWAILERKKPISSLSVEDCLAYRDFLRDPLPSDRWCGERGRARWSPLWRPFNGPLTPSSERHALNVLTSLFRWLVDQRYVVGNPFQAVPPTLDATPKIQTGRSLTKKQWVFLQEFLDAQKDAGATRRLRIVLYLAYATGLRLAELAQIKCSDFSQQVFDDDQTGWMLSVLGKGHRLRDVPIPDTLLIFLNQYLGHRGLIGDVGHPSNQDAYLIGKVDHPALRGQPDYDPKAGISVGTLAAQLKQFFYDAGKSLAKEHPQSGKRLQQASTHWLRHTHGSHAVASGTPIEIVQNNLGHANLATTTIYVTTEQKRRHAAMQKFWRQSGRARVK